MSLKRITAPTALPLTLAELKTQLRVEQLYVDEDTYILSLLDEAIGEVDAYAGIGRCLELQTWEAHYDAFPCGAEPLRIPLIPVTSIVSVKYDSSTDGTEQTWASSNYQVDLVGLDQWIVPVLNVVWPLTWLAINAVRVRFIAGYARATPDGSTVPAPIKSALKLIVQNKFDRKSDQWPDGIHHLLNPWKNILR